MGHPVPGHLFSLAGKGKPSGLQTNAFRPSLGSWVPQAIRLGAHLPRLTGTVILT